jgi:hypothetical protein
VSPGAASETASSLPAEQLDATSTAATMTKITRRIIAKLWRTPTFVLHFSLQPRSQVSFDL